MDIRFDNDQEKAFATQKNAVVRAGAGSGKTTVLAERFCYLIETKKALVDEICALTFTQKARAEMYEKIYKRLQKSESPDARIALARIDEAVISTLDSFCSEITRNWTSHFGIPPDFGYIDSGETAYKASLDFTLVNALNPALARFIGINGFEAILTRFFADFAIHHLKIGASLDFEQYYPAQIECLNAELAQGTSRLTSCFDSLRKLPRDLDCIITKQKMLETIPDLDLLVSEGKLDRFMESLRAIDTTKPRGKVPESGILLKEIIDRIKENISILFSLAHTLSEKDLIRDLLGLITLFAEEYIRRKREQGALDYGDVAWLALVTLVQNKEVRQFYKKKFKYIIIDEFQDNNSLQKNLLYLLAEKEETLSDSVPEPSGLCPAKLFFVGDEKQSIYRFRGADVSVFKLLGNELIREGGEEIRLATNYRSEPGLIGFFNGFFEVLMADANAPYEARFEGLESRAATAGIEPSITLLYKPFRGDAEDTGFSNDESEAFAVAEFVSESVRNESLLIEKDGRIVPALFDDCAVLMRSTSNQIIYERMFRLFDIPFITQGARSLFLEAPANDLYNLFQTACFPEDRVAYAGLLRSPLVNVSDSGLIRILAGEALPFDPLDSLDEIDKIKYEAGKRSYEYVVRNADISTLAALVDFFWYECGYRFYVLRDERFPNFLEYYHYIVNIARSFDDKSKTICEFLDFLRENLGKYEKLDEGDILKDEVRGVRLLTIHKSKGLEFPVVILANTGNMGRNSGVAGANPYFFSSTYGPTFNIGKHNYFYSIEKEEDEKEQAAELKRLLYVALTRSQFHLVMSGSHNARNRSSGKSHLAMILRCMGLEPDMACGPRILSSGSRVNVRIIRDLTRTEYYKKMKRTRGRDIATFEPIYRESNVARITLPRIEYNVTDLNDMRKKSVQPGTTAELPELSIDSFLSGKKAQSLFGTLCHLVLNLRIRNGRVAKADIPVSFVRDIPSDMIDPVLDTCIRLADDFFASDFGKVIDEAQVVESEFPFYYRLESGSRAYNIHGTVDLYFESGLFAYIVDFKTDKLLDASSYGFQLALYCLALEELFKKNIRCFIYPLRSGKPIEVTERASEEDVAKLIEASQAL